MTGSLAAASGLGLDRVRFARRLTLDALGLQRKHLFTNGIVVFHENFHLVEVLFAAEFGGAFYGSQIGRRLGFANPVLPACPVKADS